MVGTFACGEFNEVIAYGGTADGAWSVAISVRVAGDPVRGRAVVDSLAYLRTGGSDGAPATTLPVETAGLTVVNAGDPGERRRAAPAPPVQ